MCYTGIKKVFWYLVVIIFLLNGINCVDRENVPQAKTIQSRIGAGESAIGRVSTPLTMQPILTAPSSIIQPRKDGKIGRTKGRTVIFTLKKHPRSVLLREVRRPPQQLKRPIVHQRKGKQQTNIAAFNQLRVSEKQAQQQTIRQQHAQQERLREQQAQQQRLIGNQVQQQTILTQTAFQLQSKQSQSLIDQRQRQGQHAQQDSLRQQAFLDAVAEQERKSYLQKKRREQNRRRRFPDGLIHQDRQRNQMMVQEKQRELARQQAFQSGFTAQQSLITQQQSNFQSQQPLSQQLIGAASQQQSWIHHPQALDNTNTPQQYSEHLQLAQQQAFRNQRQPQSLQRIPMQQQKRQRLGRKVVLTIRQKS